jgi:16S rRNA processing protein RimM
VPKSRPSTLPGSGLEDGEVELGFISGVFGVRGDVRVHLYNRDSVLLTRTCTAILVGPDDSRRTVQITCRPGAGKRILGTIDGLANREEALALKDFRLLIAQEALPEPDAGEFYVRQVVGLPVIIEGKQVGSVHNVHNTAGGDLLEVAVEGGTSFVPLNGRWVLALDLEGGRIELAAGALAED